MASNDLGAPRTFRTRAWARWSLAVSLVAMSISASAPALAKKKKKKKAAAAAVAAPAHTQLPLIPEDSPSGPSVMVAVVGLGSGADDAASSLLGTAETAVRAAGRPLVRLSDALDAAGSSARDAANKKALSSLKAANEAYNEGDLEICGELGSRAEATLQQSDLTQHYPRLVRAWMLELASDANTPSKASKVSTDLEQILAASPKIDMPAGFPTADAASQASDVRSLVQSRSTGALKVTSQPSGAEVYLDGTYRGATPLSLSGLPPGPHSVISFKPGTTWTTKHITSPGDSSLSLSLDPSSDASSWSGKRDALRSAFHSSGLTGPASQLASGHADQVLVVGVESKGGSLQAMAVRIDAKSAKVLADVDAALPSDADARASALSDLVSKSLASDGQSSSHRLGGSSATASTTSSSSSSSSASKANDRPRSDDHPKEAAKSSSSSASTSPSASTSTDTPAGPSDGDSVHRPPKDLGDDIKE